MLSPRECLRFLHLKHQQAGMHAHKLCLPNQCLLFVTNNSSACYRTPRCSLLIYISLFGTVSDTIDQKLCNVYNQISLSASLGYKHCRITSLVPGHNLLCFFSLLCRLQAFFIGKLLPLWCMLWNSDSQSNA